MKGMSFMSPMLDDRDIFGSQHRRSLQCFYKKCLHHLLGRYKYVTSAGGIMTVGVSHEMGLLLLVEQTGLVIKTPFLCLCVSLPCLYLSGIFMSMCNSELLT